MGIPRTIKPHQRPRVRVVGLAMAAGLAIGLAACSSVVGDLPSQLGGLPAGTPERPAAPPAYPAVHDMPPPRTNTVLSEDERKRVEADLIAARERQAKQAQKAR